MSMAAMLWAFKQDVTSTEKLVLLALGDHADHKGICWPGMEGLAEKTGLNRETISRAIKNVESKGLLEVERRKDEVGRFVGNRYFLKINRDTPTQDHTARDREPCDAGSQESISDPEKPTNEPISSDSEFETFYHYYPRHEAKADALKAWRALKPDDALVKRIIPDLMRYEGREKQFIPLPATYLRGRRWEDERAVSGPPKPVPEAVAVARRENAEAITETLTPEQRTANAEKIRAMLKTIG